MYAEQKQFEMHISLKALIWQGIEYFNLRSTISDLNMYTGLIQVTEKFKKEMFVFDIILHL